MKKIFGVVDVDLYVVNNFFDYFGEMFFIFCNEEIFFEVVGEYI